MPRNRSHCSKTIHDLLQICLQQELLGQFSDQEQRKVLKFGFSSNRAHSGATAKKPKVPVASVFGNDSDDEKWRGDETCIRDSKIREDDLDEQILYAKTCMFWNDIERFIPGGEGYV